MTFLSQVERWKRIGKIVALFTIVAPFLVGLISFGELLLIGHFNPRYAALVEQLPGLWWGWTLWAYLVGAPYALLSGGIFAILAVLTDWSQLLVALLVAMAPLLFVHLIPAVGDPIWKWDGFFAWNAVALAAIPTAICWYLSRPWHRPPR